MILMHRLNGNTFIIQSTDLYTFAIIFRFLQPKIGLNNAMTHKPNLFYNKISASRQE